uniref:Uncharacterized protein n=1 Tax=Oryza nivara TaxID=4536 RepID=A0A0E0H4D3_ORYNI
MAQTLARRLPPRCEVAEEEEEREAPRREPGGDELGEKKWSHTDSFCGTHQQSPSASEGCNLLLLTQARREQAPFWLHTQT